MSVLPPPVSSCVGVNPHQALPHSPGDDSDLKHHAAPEGQGPRPRTPSPPGRAGGKRSGSKKLE